ncbi:LysR substrate-binding domain-containing protein [Sinorhizobium sp. 8-89]|uniref:LysR substrate-binding domain-containing protein n=1 Tax=Sinorhizobium sp. 7-81 TaxID=3049087 RepID=UPI0024C22A7B|nr:LysR substrate-binding domain-containing protein [Sinorhizobium sp. 7-81]MDK1389018.1 LysR substrate-binding domain-containing protein [Sinorhizobium sp. 7-81]
MDERRFPLPPGIAGDRYLECRDGRIGSSCGQVFSSASGAALIQAALAGLGAAYLLRCLVAKELQAGALVTFASEIALPSLPFNALHAFGRTVPLRVKLFCDFIAREARAIEAM